MSVTEKIMHIPVLLNEVLKFMNIHDDGNYLDATFGAGGYSRAILKAANCNLYSIDQDLSVLKFAQEIINENFHFIHSNFIDIGKNLPENIFFDGIVFDIGVSSMQLDMAERGFSFSKNGPLDMRMNKNIEKNAANFVNEMEEKEIARIIYEYSDEKFSRIIARKIVEARKIKPFETTFELAEIVRGIVKKTGDIDPATRTFQAIRIWVNNELENLKIGLEKAFTKLKPKGRMLVVTFHSLEDKIVKNYFARISAKLPENSRYMPEASPQIAQAKLIVRKPIIPNNEEINKNPRARSAKLRIIEKLGIL